MIGLLGQIKTEDFQNKGYGTYRLKAVLAVLKEHGLFRKQEEYQGDVYEYNLYLRR